MKETIVFFQQIHYINFYKAPFSYKNWFIMLLIRKPQFSGQCNFITNLQGMLYGVGEVFQCTDGNRLLGWVL